VTKETNKVYQLLFTIDLSVKKEIYFRILNNFTLNNSGREETDFEAEGCCDPG
jgi:hypothetical protein